MKLSKRLLVLGLFGAVVCASTAQAKVINVEFRWSKDQPDEMDLGIDGNLPKMTYNSEERTFRAAIDIAHVEPKIYSLVFRFGTEQYNIDLEMFQARSDINMGVAHVVPQECRDIWVREADTAADNNNIPQALSRYLLASQLMAIKGDRRCRLGQPKQLERARIQRSIQLGTFRGSPFKPTLGDQTQFAAVLGAPVASTYAKQIEANSVTSLHIAVREGILNGDSDEKVSASKDLNDYLAADLRKDPSRKSVYLEAGINSRILAGNADALRNAARD